MEVLVNKKSKIYIEKRRTLGLYHIVHQNNCSIIPKNADFFEVDDPSELNTIINSLDEKYPQLEKCQACFKDSK